MRRLLGDSQLRNLRDQVLQNQNWVTSRDIQALAMATHGVAMNESTIRGRFIAMKQPLSRATQVATPQVGQPQQVVPPRPNATTGGGIKPPNTGMSAKPPPPPDDDGLNVKVPERTKRGKVEIPADYHKDIPQELNAHIPNGNLFAAYVTRGVDTRLALNYDLQGQTRNGQTVLTYPLTQGKQGTGKTFGHQYYAYTRALPFFLFSCYKDFQLRKLFGDKSLESGNIVFKEGLFVKAIQSPGVVVFDEVNAISHENTYDFLNLLQDRQLFVKDADNGNGKVYKLHPMCKIGFAQNPRSSKYIGGNIRASNFLGRCTYITYPEFTDKQLHDALGKRYPTLTPDDRELFVKFYREILRTIDRNELPFDVSVRQLNNVIDLWLHGADLKEALEDGLISISDAASQPQSKQALMEIARGTWSELSYLKWRIAKWGNG